MDFISIVEIIDRRYSRFLKFLLGITCLLSAFAFLAELIANGRISTLYIIVLIVVFPAFLRMGEKNYPMDISCNILETPMTFNVYMSKVFIDKKDTFDRMYVINKKNLHVLTNDEKAKIAFVGEGVVKILDQNKQVVYEQRYENETVELSVGETTFKELTSYLADYLDKNKD